MVRCLRWWRGLRPARRAGVGGTAGPVVLLAWSGRVRRHDVLGRLPAGSGRSCPVARAVLAQSGAEPFGWLNVAVALCLGVQGVGEGSEAGVVRGAQGGEVADEDQLLPGTGDGHVETAQLAEEP